MKWDTLLRGIGILGMVAAYGIYTVNGANIQVLILVIMAIGTLVSPEFVHNMPMGPTKD